MTFYGRIRNRNTGPAYEHKKVPVPHTKWLMHRITSKATGRPAHEPRKVLGGAPRLRIQKAAAVPTAKYLFYLKRFVFEYFSSLTLFGTVFLLLFS